MWNAGGCHSWYLHPSGRNAALWPDHTFVFRRFTRHFDIAACAVERAAAQHPLRDGDERLLRDGYDAVAGADLFRSLEAIARVEGMTSLPPRAPVHRGCARGQHATPLRIGWPERLGN